MPETIAIVPVTLRPGKAQHWPSVPKGMTQENDRPSRGDAALFDGHRRCQLQATLSHSAEGEKNVC